MAERTRVALVCSECGARNYQTTRAVGGGVKRERLSLKKHCKTCAKHTVHKESK